MKTRFEFVARCNGTLCVLGTGNIQTGKKPPPPKATTVFVQAQNSKKSLQKIVPRLPRTVSHVKGWRRLFFDNLIGVLDPNGNLAFEVTTIENGCRLTFKWSGQCCEQSEYFLEQRNDVAVHKFLYDVNEIADCPMGGDTMLEVTTHSCDQLACDGKAVIVCVKMEI